MESGLNIEGCEQDDRYWQDICMLCKMQMDSCWGSHLINGLCICLSKTQKHMPASAMPTGTGDCVKETKGTVGKRPLLTCS